MDAKEIVHCALQIEKSNADRSYGNILTLLGDLDKSHISAELLETTDIVKVLYGLLKTCFNGDVKRTAKHLLSKWKRQYSKGGQCKEDRKHPGLSCSVSAADEDEGGFKQEGSSSGSAQTCDTAVVNVLSQTCDGVVENVTAEQKAPSSSAKNGHQALRSTAESSSSSSDIQSIRSKCVQLLVAALHAEPPDQDKAAALAVDVEQHIHKIHGLNQVKYKASVRSRVANLRNPKNGHLRLGLFSGSLTPEVFAQMSAEEMAGAELRQLREQLSSRGVSERQLPQGIEGTKTQKIRCERCGGSDCSVTQVSRGALFLPAWVRRGGPDEDAMTFVTCSWCGQQWYHSSWVCL